MTSEENSEYIGIFKLIEETGELLQVLGKLGAFPDTFINHPDGTNLREKLIEELADCRAALSYFVNVNFTTKESAMLTDRMHEKYEKFIDWKLSGLCKK